MKNNIYLNIIGVCILTYLVGMFCVPVMDIDAAQYASMSREMLLTGNYLQLHDLGVEYLDKPPMLFWLSSQSLRIFGMHDWAYRLPSFLFSILAIYSTYRLALLFYKKEIALLSAVVIAASQAMFLINHDVRTDTMLMGWVTCSIWQLAEWYQYNKWKNLLLAGVMIAGGMMTKGPLAFMIPVFAFGPHFLMRRNWNNFFRWQYLVLLLVIAILLIPMSIGLYQQFDLHPEKLAAAKSGGSGLRFFYWTQSFGRITGANHNKENASIFFLLQNMLWSFLPWIIFLLIGLFAAVKNIIQKRFLLTNKEEYITVSGFLVTYLALGSSKVQLPHYIFVVFPLAAIITANFLYQLLYDNEWARWRKPLFIFHAIVFTLLWLALLLLLSSTFETISRIVVVIAALFFIGFLWLLYYKKLSFPRLIAMCVFTSIGLNIFLNTSFYPSLLKYQAGNIAAKYIEEQRLPKDKIYVFGNITDFRNSLYFYGDYFFKKINETGALKKGDIVMTSAEDYNRLIKDRNVTIIFTGKSFYVTKLSLKFLRPSKREGELMPFYIVTVN